MFADDLVILSESAKGLQNAIDRLQNYCTKWGLTVNIDKTKVVIFNKGGHPFSSYKFTLNGLKVDIVQSYCYLGIIFSSSGTFNRACEALSNKAFKAFFKKSCVGGVKLSFYGPLSFNISPTQPK